MKKIFIIFTNIILLILFFFILDFSMFYIDRKIYINNKTFRDVILYYFKEIKTLLPYIKSTEIRDKILIEPSDHTTLYRPVENKNAKKNILIFGCSFAYGDKLKENETFSYKLGERLKNYKIYNRAYSGWSAQHMLYQIENEKFRKIIPKPDYVIYVFTPWQLVRTYIHCNCYDNHVFYKLGKDNKLHLLKFSLNYSNSYLLGYLGIIYDNILKHGETKYENEFFFLHIYQTLDDIKKYWGDDVKFIFLAYEEYPYYEYMINKDYDKLKEKGAIIVKLSDISNTCYSNNVIYQISNNDGHPNAKAWDEITPLFVKHLQNMGYLK